MQKPSSSSVGSHYHSSSVTLPSTSDQSPQHNVHAVLKVNGEVNRKKLFVLIDSGATVSAINQEVVGKPCVHLPESQQSTTIGANGLPLNVVGHVTLPVAIGDFNAQQKFVVVKNLSVDCLLGTDFLTAHKVVIDCGEQVLHIGGSNGPAVPFAVDSALPPSSHSLVSVLHTVEVPDVQ